ECCELRTSIRCRCGRAIQYQQSKGQYLLVATAPGLRMRSRLRVPGIRTAGGALAALPFHPRRLRQARLNIPSFNLPEASRNTSAFHAKLAYRTIVLCMSAARDAIGVPKRPGGLIASKFPFLALTVQSKLP